MIAHDTAMIVTERTKMGVEEISIPREIEADGFITRKQDIKSLERVGDNTARPTSECCYPKCEECRDYISYQGANYCTVPMVLSKQDWLSMHAWAQGTTKRLTELETLVIDEILRSDKPQKSDPPNYTWDEYLGETK